MVIQNWFAPAVKSRFQSRTSSNSSSLRSFSASCLRGRRERNTIQGRVQDFGQGSQRSFVLGGPWAPKFAQTRGFLLKFACKLHDFEKIFGARGPGPKAPWIRQWYFTGLNVQKWSPVRAWGETKKSAAAFWFCNASSILLFEPEAGVCLEWVFMPLPLSLFAKKSKLAWYTEPFENEQRTQIGQKMLFLWAIDLNSKLKLKLRTQNQQWGILVSYQRNMSKEPMVWSWTRQVADTCRFLLPAEEKQHQLVSCDQQPSHQGCPHHERDIHQLMQKGKRLHHRRFKCLSSVAFGIQKV